MICICAKGTLTEHWAIWKYNHKAKIKLFKIFIFQVIKNKTFHSVFAKFLNSGFWGWGENKCVYQLSQFNGQL